MRFTKINAVPLYEQIADYVRRQIQRGRWEPGSKLPPEPELATQFQTSRNTLRKALKLLEKQDFIRQRKGKGTFVASRPGLAGRTRIGVLGLSPAARANYHHGAILRGIEEGFRQNGISPEILFLPTDRDFLEHVRSGDVDGLFLSPGEREAALVAATAINSIPYVIFSASFLILKEYDNVFIDTDNFGGAVAAMEYLIGLGHRTISHICCDTNRCNAQDRLRGYLAAMRKHNLPLDESLILEYGGGSDEDRERVRRLLEERPEITAVFAEGFGPVLDVYAAAKQLGRRIPEDISVVGFDDPEEARFLAPPVTTVRQPTFEMGMKAAEMMRRQLAGEPLEARQVILQTELIVRESCCAPVQ